MDMFITDIKQQTITIDGTVYDADYCAGEMLAEFRRRYGTDSFYAEVAEFLAEWFNDDDRLTVHTSGSTGAPKPLRVEKHRMMNSAMLTVDFLGLRHGDSAMLCMPLKYIAGKMVVVRSLVAGLNLLPVTPCGHPMQAIGEIPVFSAMIPMQVFNSLQTDEERKRLMDVRHLIIGGGAIDEALGKALKSFPHAVWSTYGMTETLSHIALRRLNGKEASEWYTPFSNVDVRLTPDHTLAIHAPLVNPELLITNDIVEFNARGQFRILGRKDNTVNTGGVKVQIEQVEASLRPLLPCPFMVTSAPDAKFGERIVLLVENFAPDSPAIRQAVETLPAYWRPKQTVCITRLPQTGTGKPDRATAKKIAASAPQNPIGKD